MPSSKDKRKSQIQDATRQMASAKYAEAESILSNLLTSFPGDPEVCRLLATLHLKRGQLTVALSETKFLATAALRAQDYTLAEGMIREYLQVDPNCPPLIELLGQVYEEKGDRSSAVAQYASAIDMLLARPDPDFPELPGELYQKITTLMPGSPVVQRLAPSFASKPTGVQYAAPAGDAAPSPAPRPSVEPRTAAEGIPAPVVSMESDADFRRLVSAPTDDAGSQEEETPAEPPASPESEQGEPAPAEVPAAPSRTPSAFRLAPSTPTVPSEPEPVQDEPEIPVVTPAEAMAAPPPVEQPVPTWQPEPAATEPPRTEVEEAEQPEAVEAEPETVAVAEPAAVDVQEAPAAVPARRRRRKGILGWLNRWIQQRGAAKPAEALVVQAPPAPPRRRRRPRKQTAVDYKAKFMRSRLSRWLKNTVAAARFTGRLIALLMVLSVVLPLLSTAGLALYWLSLEQKPSETFQALAAPPPQKIQDPKRNGYFLLLGLAERPGVDPMKAGYERWQRVELQPPRCTDPSEEPERPLLVAGDVVALSGWFRNGIPTTEFFQRRTVLAEWTRANQLLTSRYEQWFTMPFEDAGYGTLTGPDCAQILAVHRLYLAAGFAEQVEEGLARLELDLGAWRHVLLNAKTLSMKLLALRAIEDDVGLLSDLLARPDLDAKLLPRLMRLAKPLEPAERSLRVPMHNEFLIEVRLSERGFYVDTDLERPLALQALTHMPLPKQRTLNAHAAYYDAVMKASDLPSAALPSLYGFAHTPARGWVDYLKNPLDNLLAHQPVPDWADYAGAMLEADARFRLAGLQARLRVPSRDGVGLLARIAEAGPPFFDPFTELPMLTNGAKTLLYSIGRDRVDNNGDPRRDIIVPIFSAAPML